MEPDEYRKMAATEDSLWYYRALHRHVVRSLGAVLPVAQARVLDAGCGTGGLLRRMRAAQPQWALTGVDVSPLAVELAQQYTGGAASAGTDAKQGSVEALPFAGEEFDAVVSCDVLCQVEEPEKALREFHRVLRPDGFVVLTMPSYQWMYSYHDREVGNLRRYSRREVASLLREAEFEIVRDTYWNTLPFPLAVLRRKVFTPSAPTSDVKPFPAPVDAVFSALMALEHAWLGAGARFPFGNSVLTVARKSRSVAR
jgi:ubiquinone/menaquinone biosynthesis C-methylase UbiE